MKKKEKYYAVWYGLNAGVYDTWEECQRQVIGVKGAKYKSFPTREEALEALAGGPAAETTHEPAPRPAAKAVFEEPAGEMSIAVDAACSGNPGPMEYQGVVTATGQVLFHQGPFADGNNNVGEFLAIVHGLAWLNQHGLPTTPVYSDSRTARAWVRDRHAKTNLKPTARNARLFELIGRAEQWLHTHQYKNPVLTWETDKWGEIPADFGRK